MNKISIIIPTLNSSKSIIRCLDSVFKQTYKNWEIIVVDSFSSDNTVNLINGYRSKKIKIFYISKKMSISKARYKGVCKASGNYIAFLDSDDEWYSNKLELQNKGLSKDIFFSCTHFILKNKTSELKIKTTKKILNLNDLIYDRPIALSSVLIKKQLIKKVMKQNLSINYAEDYYWWSKILKDGKNCFVIRKFLTKIYIHETNRSINFYQNYLSLIKIYKTIYQFSYIKIIYIFFKLTLNTFSKNILKFHSFKKIWIKFDKS